MQDTLNKMQEQALGAISAALDRAELEAVRIRFFGKKGELTAVMRQMGALSAEQRPVVGALANDIRSSIESALSQAAEKLEAEEAAERLCAEAMDITLPGVKPTIGHRHPMSLVLSQVKHIFLGMGFTIAEGPEVETTYYCFDALNTGQDHPARDMQDTFYFDAETILRTQTSSVQIRAMEKSKPPIRLISPGRVYRKDKIDATHSPMFHQVEGLAVDEGITMADLKGTLQTLMEGLYGKGVKLRFRPHHFPYTEPSAEVDLECFACRGKGCPMCKQEGFIEMLGAGMVHPEVLRRCGIDPEIYSGFAFGVGVERLTLMRYNINDMRLLFENDVRFLRQFV
ncbi:MAG: phenylalanine--tRNA ligase subunit alpha [Oscillospiraceae bacterium]|nr:phenylalanine--tRNA ligase subunit alpha [Oscillospiraceae bacterium]